MSDEVVRAEVIRLLNAKKKHRAVRYVRQQKDMNLTTAVAFVDALDEEINPFMTSPVLRHRGRVKKGFPIFTFAFGIMSLLLLIASIILFYQDMAFIRNSHRETGTIISLDNPDTFYYSAAPLIRYTWQDKVRTHQVKGYSGGFALGQKKRSIYLSSLPIHQKSKQMFSQSAGSQWPCAVG